MLKLRSIIFCLIFGLTLSGCAPKNLFYWGNYEDSLYERYINNDTKQTEIYLRELIDNAAKENMRVPPGIFADYGFILYQRGDKKSAIDYFKKEKQLYPESQILMNKLIKRVKRQTTQP